MASDKSKKPADDSKNEPPKLPPLTPAKRKALQMQFEKGSALAGKGDFDYANSMFTYCVAGDPGNVIYTQSFLGNLMRKYNNNKKGAKLATLSIERAIAKGALKKCRVRKDWLGAIKAGLKVLKRNPWDTPVLVDVSAALGELGASECAVEYLKLALSADSKDVEINKAAAAAFEEVADFDSAISCWQRIAQKSPHDQQVKRTIDHLTVSKTIHKGGYEEAESSIDVSVEKKASELRKADDDITPEVKLRRDIRRKPEEVTNYIELSNHFWKLEDFDAAEKVMAEACQVTGSIRAREFLEDVQLNRARRAVALAERKAAEEKTEKAATLFKQLRVELNSREMEIYGGRCDRYPLDCGLKYEFGLRLYKAGKFKEAITQFQEGRNEPKKMAAANLQLGKCFQQLKKFDLALESYRKSVETCGLWDDEVKKEALYLAGKLAKGMRDYVTAMKFFTQLAGLEYGYRDVAELLDETARLLQEGDKPSPP